ncbi:MAG: NBR1-Ig-like domain-containing protein [Chloroflexota bacterium]
MNTKKTMLVLSTALILLVISACGPATETAAPTQEGALQTAIVDTAQAAVAGTLTQMALLRPSDTPIPAFTEIPLLTETKKPRPTSDKPMISVSKETNCRLGPDVVYERVGMLDPGVMAEVFALDPTRGYYFIENPDNPGTYCWVWGFYATPVNDLAALPIYTPAHTPILANTSTPSLTTTFTPTGTLNTPTPTPTGTLNTPTATTTGACTFVSLVPPNNSKFTPGQEYIDFIWIVKNTGTTTWDKTKVSYKFISGQNFNKKGTTVLLTDDIAPGAISTLLDDIVVPTTIGKYTETWALVQDGTTLCSVTLTIEVIKP